MLRKVYNYPVKLIDSSSTDLVLVTGFEVHNDHNTNVTTGGGFIDFNEDALKLEV